MVRGRSLLAGVIVLSVALSLPLPSAPAALDAACTDFRDRPDIGPSCLHSNGLLEVFSSQGESLGYTHGGDPVPRGEAAIAFSSTPTPAACVDGSDSIYHALVIYARAQDDSDQYATTVPTLRDMVADANQWLVDAADATGGPVRLKVKCTAGQVEVRNEVLPTKLCCDTFSSIQSDLRALGYNDPRVKYWVFYDDTGFSFGGQANIFNDDRPGADNPHNGNSGPMFAITYGWWSAFTMLHELGHNLGAVQKTAPHSTLEFHCRDGLDVMCYADIGPLGPLYRSDVCAPPTPFDCNKDDYFHRNPPLTNYLATHWNLGNPVNRFLTFGPPLQTSLTCTKIVILGSPATCSFSATDDSPGVRYAIDWGDGATQCHPSCAAFTAPGILQTLDHTYAANGFWTVTVSATDNGSPPATSNSKSFIVAIGDASPPVITLTDPAPGAIYSGCTKVPSTGPVRAQFVFQGCAKGDVADLGGVANVKLFYDGVFKGQVNFVPFVFVWTTPGPATNKEVRIEATDLSGNTATVTTFVDVVR